MMPAGRYYVGDLCYVMHDVWDEFCSITIQDRECLNGEFMLKDGRRFATYSTMYGDGLYQDTHGRSYSVDAGLIGCIRVEDIRDDEAWIEGGQIVEINHPFHTGDENGTIRIGPVSIATGDEEGYEYDEEE